MNHSHPYRNLGLMVLASFIAMYGLMYAMVNISSNVFANYNQLYMAGLMVCPMVLLELFLMGAMYKNKRLNLALVGISLICFTLFWVGIRRQEGIGDDQFLRSMIPHHAGAILMCNEAKLSDPEIKELCRNILSSQQKEIDFMKAKLEALAK